MDPSNDVVFKSLDGLGALQRFEEIQDVYAQAFPSSDLGDYRWRIFRQAEAPDFGAVVAEVSGRIVGFVYGLALAEETGWWDGLRPSPQPGFTTENGRRTCAVIDLAVLPGRRGKGLGRRLMSEFLGSRTEERATLATDPHDHAVQAMYERWGWRKVGVTPGGEHETEPEFDIYVTSLRQDEDATNSR